MIKTVIRIESNIVFVFDEKGDELTEYQGEYENVKHDIMSNCNKDTIFIHWFGISQKPKITDKGKW
jgi:hypothetical protein